MLGELTLAEEVDSLMKLVRVWVSIMLSISVFLVFDCLSSTEEVRLLSECMRTITPNSLLFKKAF